MTIIQPNNSIWIDKYHDFKSRQKHLYHKASHKQAKHQCFYMGCEEEQAPVGTPTKRRRNIDLLCETHRTMIKTKIIELIEFLGDNIDNIMNEIKDHYNDNIWQSTRFLRDKERDKYYEVISDNHLMYEYYKNSDMEEYFRHDPELFVCEMISIETDNQKYTFYEIPKDSLKNIFISSLQRKINDSLTALKFVNIISTIRNDFNKDVIINKQKDKIEELQHKIDTLEAKIYH
jgi:hypothetical protein